MRGDGALTDVVCGAPNVRVGMKTAFAKVGAQIGDITITSRKLAGYPSNYTYIYSRKRKSASAMTIPALWKLPTIFPTART